MLARLARALAHESILSARLIKVGNKSVTLGGFKQDQQSFESPLSVLQLFDKRRAIHYREISRYRLVDQEGQDELVR